MELNNLATVKATVKIEDVKENTYSKTLEFPYTPTEYESSAEFLKKLNESDEGFMDYIENSVDIDADDVASYKVRSMETSKQ